MTPEHETRGKHEAQQPAPQPAPRPAPQRTRRIDSIDPPFADGAPEIAAHAFMTSAISSAAALLSWMFIDMVNDKKTTLVGASTGLVLGLVAITPGAGFVPIWASFIIGALVSPICYYGVILVKKKLKIDE